MKKLFILYIASLLFVSCAVKNPPESVKIYHSTEEIAHSIIKEPNPPIKKENPNPLINIKWHDYYFHIIEGVIRGLTNTPAW